MKKTKKKVVKGTTLDEVMAFLQTEGVVKDDLKNFATKDDIRILTSRVDAFENKMIVELRFINNELGEIKDRLARLEKRTKEDSDATIKEVVFLKKRVDFLERQVKQLQASR